MKSQFYGIIFQIHPGDFAAVIALVAIGRHSCSRNRSPRDEMCSLDASE